MSRAKSSAKSPSTNTGDAVPQAELAAFLRGLAARAEADLAFAAQLDTALRESGLLDRPPAAHGTAASPSRKRASSHPRAAARDTWQQFAGGDLPDPFALLRDRGEAGLRASLDALDLPALRALVRVHRLDPARISARWTARDRVVALIVAQVRARADLGKAFSRV
jgi:hypothetical protein